MSNRDTQFKGFAEKLYQEIEDLTCSFSVLPSADEMKRLECEIYARRAYDLVKHSFSGVREFQPHATILSDEEERQYIKDEVLPQIPDLTELPKEQAE